MGFDAYTNFLRENYSQAPKKEVTRARQSRIVNEKSVVKRITRETHNNVADEIGKLNVVRKVKNNQAVVLENTSNIQPTFVDFPQEASMAIDGSRSKEFVKKVNTTITPQISYDNFMPLNISTKSLVETKVSTKEGVLLCAIAKLENNYIREWVEHYKKLGFANIVLFDNNDIGGERFEDVIWDYIESGFVILENARGKKHYQIEAYNVCIKKYKEQYKWIAFFDIDEFLSLSEDKTINGYLANGKFNNFNCVKVCWENYSDNGLLCVENGNYSVNRFTKPIDYDMQAKSIVRTNINFSFMKDNPHVPRGIKSVIYPCNTKGEPCNNNISIGNRTTLSCAKLKHYRFKTIEEYVLNKMQRLWATTYKNGGKDGLTLDFFFTYNKKTQEKEELATKLLNSKPNNTSVCTKNLSIAIVGNSPCALGKGKGKEIDSHDIVLRFNNYHIHGYEKDLGTKTDMIAVVSVIKNYNKTDKFLSLPKEMRIFRDDKNPRDNHPIDVVFGGKVTEDDVVRVDDFIYKVKNRMHGYKMNHFPSTGLVMMQYIFDKYPNAKIDTYGVSFFNEKKIHIYDNQSGDYHDKEKEKWYFETFLKERIKLHDSVIKYNKTIAIVGNSPILMEQNYGEEIDAHDMVVRINDFMIEGFEKYAGSKTTDVVFQTRTPYHETIFNMPKEHNIFIIHLKLKSY